MTIKEQENFVDKVLMKIKEERPEDFERYQKSMSVLYPHINPGELTLMDFITVNTNGKVNNLAKAINEVTALHWEQFCYDPRSTWEHMTKKQVKLILKEMVKYYKSSEFAWIKDAARYVCRDNEIFSLFELHPEDFDTVIKELPEQMEDFTKIEALKIINPGTEYIHPSQAKIFKAMMGMNKMTEKEIKQLLDSFGIDKIEDLKQVHRDKMIDRLKWKVI